MFPEDNSTPGARDGRTAYFGESSSGEQHFPGDCDSALLQRQGSGRAATPRSDHAHAQSPEGPSQAATADGVAQRESAMQPESPWRTAGTESEAPPAWDRMLHVHGFDADHGHISGPHSARGDVTVPYAGAHTRHLAPADDLAAPHAGQEAFMEDLQEAIEAVAIDTAPVLDPSRLRHSHESPIRLPHASVAGSPLPPFPADAHNGFHATPQPMGQFQVYSSASGTSVGHTPPAGDAGSSQEQSTNKYIARMKLPTVQPWNRSRSWMHSSGGLQPCPDGAVCGDAAGPRPRGPTGFDPVAGLLGFSASSGSGRRELLLDDRASPVPRPTPGVAAGGGWGGSFPGGGRFSAEVCANICAAQ